jgi:hypothetical protein
MPQETPTAPSDRRQEVVDQLTAFDEAAKAAESQDNPETPADGGTPASKGKKDDKKGDPKSSKSKDSSDPATGAPDAAKLAEEGGAKAKSDADPSVKVGEDDEPAVEGDLDGNVDPDAVPEEVAKHPKFIEATKQAEFAQELKDACIGNGLDIDFDADPVAGIKNLKAQLADAGALYGILNGTQSAKGLIGLLESNYPSETQQRVFTEVVNAMVENKFLDWYCAASGYKLVPVDDPGTAVGDSTQRTGAETPEARRIKQLEAEINNIKGDRLKNQNTEAEKATQEHQKKIFDSFTDEVKRLCTEKGLEPIDHSDYIDALSKKVAGNPAIIKRITNGNFVDIKKFFAEYHNAVLERAKRYSAKIATTKTKVENTVPKAAPGGGTPSGSKAATKPLSSEDRRRSVADQL